MTMGSTRCVVLNGIEGAVVDVEADIVSGLPAFAIGGLPDAACRHVAHQSRLRYVAPVFPFAFPRKDSA